MIDKEEFSDEFEISISQCHTLAAQHLQAAARQHLEAADAHDSGNLYETHRRAYLAHRHQLLAEQYVDMAAIENDDLELEEGESELNRLNELPEVLMTKG
jgi:hypothetical protein